jgi:cytochrome b6-f complex iron-sulfur subunit
MTRREFLYYGWAASMALFMAQIGGALVWFALPRFRAGEFGGAFTVPLDKIPPPDSAAPADFPDGRFWLVNAGEQIANDPRTPPGYKTATGVAAIYKICVHLGCLYKWTPTNNRFECPCHGSKYLLNGVRIDGPARRNLDRFIIRAVDAEGKVLAETKSGNADQDSTAGLPIQIPAGAAALIVDTGRRILGERNPK